MNTTSFYANLPLRAEFSDVGRPESHTPLPDSWHVVMCDARNSTAAVESGRYKKSSTLGIYRELVAKVREICGADEDCHPVWPPNLSFTLPRSSAEVCLCRKCTPSR